MTVEEHAWIEPLDADESRALLMTAELGRLAFTDENGPTRSPGPTPSRTASSCCSPRSG